MTEMRQDPLLEISPDQHEDYDSYAHYVVRQDWDGSLYVDIVDGNKLEEFKKSGEISTQIDGTIIWRDIPEEIEKELYLERRVDVDPNEIETYYIATGDGDDDE